MSRRRATWLVQGLVVLLGVASVVVLVLESRRGNTALEAAVSMVDNLTQARLEVAQAVALAERLGAGDPTVSPTGPVAELDRALGLLQDLRDGRASILGIDGAPLDGSGWREAIGGFAQRVETLRDDIDSGRFQERDPVEKSLLLSEVDEAALTLERAMFVRLTEYLAASEDRHRIRLAVWVLLLAGALGLFTAVRRGRDEAIAARSAAEGRYAALATHAAAGLVRTDGDGHLLEDTDWFRRLFAMDPGEWEGSVWWAGLQGADRDRAAELWRFRAHRKSAFLLEFRCTDSEGNFRWMTSRWVRVDDDEEASESGSWVGTIIDQTRHHRVEEQLHQAQKMEAMGRLSSGIAHDFNNLLAVMMVNADMLRESPEVRGKVRDLVDEIAEAAESGRDLIRSLMRISRETPLNIQSIDLGSSVQDSARLARRLLPGRVELIVQVPDGGPRVHADPGAVQQILLNLVSNAQRAIPGHGRIRIQVDRVEIDEEYRDENPWVELGDYGRITVSDTGVGMDRETRDKVFDPFFTTREEGEGTGLGLATVHGLVRQHGGHIHVYSELGEGSTFRLYLPEAAGREARHTDEGEHSPDRTEPTPMRRNILIVDDDDQLRRTARRLLVRLGHTVTEASSGDQAWAILKDDEKLNLVISDVTMQRMSGLELLGKLRAEGDDRPFVLTSGRSAEDVTDDGPLPEGVGFLAKPWTVAELREALDEVS